MSRIVSTALAVGGLTGGFATARSTRNRALGGAVLAAAGTGAFLIWKKDAGTARAVILTAAYLGAFGGSHPLAKNMSPWTAVNTVSAAVAAASLIFGGRRAK
ncbi:hypothetical protein GcLGCM259_0512 [Glutamicibacter creatinolyticus]|uniref:Uncharacterized protein n=1 Tax=Glutamicibacter creatinolyticus TaxID=162496 RepID=A0A5B7WQU2_9MICC|nr:hypothetical protein [Glutamicibacter creatinolyticus]QCY46277.1 hypothetical protein GcLGCM259_0512 [Glutamicibacter creatinolyticus]